MPNIRRSIVRNFALVMVALVTYGAQPVLAQSAPATPKLSFGTVEQTARQVMTDRPGYQDGDLLNQGDFDLILVAINKLGWQPADAKDIRDRMLASDSFVVQQLSSPAGIKFMRQIKSFPDGYDRLDKISQLPDGYLIIPRLIKGADGYKLIEYMTTTRGGKNLGLQIEVAPAGKGFTQPTNRIYAMDQLMQALETSWAAKSTKKR